MPEPVDLFELEVIAAPEPGAASSHGVGGFQQIVAEIAVAGFNHLRMLRFKAAGLALCPDKAGIFGDRCLGVETVNIADLGDDTGRVDLADAGDSCFSRVRF